MAGIDKPKCKTYLFDGGEKMRYLIYFILLMAVVTFILIEPGQRRPVDDNSDIYISMNETVR